MTISKKLLSPPNGVRLSCGDTLERSQTQFYSRMTWRRQLQALVRLLRFGITSTPYHRTRSQTITLPFVTRWRSPVVRTRSSTRWGPRKR